jgi:IrrE N-terminal-like domain
MMDDYRVKARSNREISDLAKKLRAYYGIANDVYIDVLDCLKRDRIWTVQGERRLNFLVRPDNEMGRSDGSTISNKDAVTIAVKESVRDAAFLGVGRARNTLAHELGHAVMHEGAPMHRRSDGNMKLNWLQPFESAEHQAKVFAPAFLVDDEVAGNLDDAEEISVKFGISLESADIYFKEFAEQRERTKNAERVLGVAQKLAADFSESLRPSRSAVRYIEDVCTSCHCQTVLPIGIKFMCTTCGNVSDRFQDGDPA